MITKKNREVKSYPPRCRGVFFPTANTERELMCWSELSVWLNLKNVPHSLLTKEMDRLRKNPPCCLQREIYLSSTLHSVIFMLFHILPIPLPEIKLGLLLEAPACSLNTTADSGPLPLPRSEQENCSTCCGATLPDDEKLMQSFTANLLFVQLHLHQLEILIKN